MGKYKIEFYIFDHEFSLSVKADGLEDGEQKIMEKPLLDVLKEITLGDAVESYSASFEED